MYPPRSLSLNFLFLSLLSLISHSAAAILTITIPPTHQLPNPNTLPGSTHATLTTLSSSSTSASGTPGLLRAPITRKSTFEFQTPAGPQSYLLDIRSRDYIFAPYRVDVDAEGGVIGVWETYRGNAWDNKGVEKVLVRSGTSGQGGEVVVVEANVVGKRGFYEERAGFSPLSLFKNPMILLAIFAMAMMFGMPYLMDNMDPEMRAEFEKQSRSGPLGGALTGTAGGKGGAGRGAPAPPSFDLAGWMAGTSQGPMAALDASVKASTSAREGGNGGSSAGRRR
ncbi:hypothetical protein FQN50_005590 [Emmonsiellopsis sp. PD_5]|nr:hypothetical protein FQN50_005590 [Emmonsiellopsis sp. PD_5]